MTSVQEFLEYYEACEDGLNWAVANCKTMQEAWDTAQSDLLVWIATRDGVLTEKELRLFTCFCARQNWELLTDERSRNAVEVAERYANGQATGEELVTAYTAAWEVAGAEWDAAGVAWAATKSSAIDAVTLAALAEWSTEEALDAQVDYLRKNCKPCFELKWE